MRSPEKTNDHENEKVRVHPASPALISWPLNDGASRLDITVQRHMGILYFFRKGSLTP